MLTCNEIYNRDCVDGMRQMDADSVDITVTSPPYDALRDYKGFSWDYKQVITELFRVTKMGGVVVWIVNDQTINGSESGNSFRQALYFLETGFNLHDTMIWHKVSPNQHKNRYIPSFEYMFILSKGKPKTINLLCDRKNKKAGQKMDSSTVRSKDGVLYPTNSKKTEKRIKEYGLRFNIWTNTPEAMKNIGHPAIYPVGLVIDHLKTWSDEKALVLDPFIGSGTTALACIQTNRRYIGFEISAEYCRIAQERINGWIEAYPLFHGG